MHVKRWAPAVLTLLALSGVSAAPAIADERPGLSWPDHEFLRAAHQGHLAEIAAGQDARQGATTDCVKETAATLVADHNRLGRRDWALAGRLGVPLPGMPTDAQRQELAAVKAGVGSAEYDEAWLSSRRAAHQRALELIDRQLDWGSNPEVKAAARAARPVVAGHLRMLRAADTCRTEPSPAAVQAEAGGQGTTRDDREAILGVAALGSGGVLLIIGWRMAVAHRRSTDER
ncbi:DUF4142 domain-containing protein [Streptomyces ureilyticus]|uniref:DUF4142 domain-containing protein n=1 Tax=Streptomyces ureilyticus TaxID=1775131 RepID=A0ABX0DP41_9ACTN|nr:DUF4142 domain-containing protein [Streptomyces ureilyticus]NGO43185.1 DUF4142 domain-containing protein [Streptomyces ureilyticus]